MLLQVSLTFATHSMQSRLPGDSDGKESACNAGAWVLSLGWEDSLEKGMTTHSNILAQEIPWTEEPEELQSMGF